jgi:hypothetical protein
MTSFFAQNIQDNEERKRREQIEALRSTARSIDRLDVDGLIKALNNIAKSINNLADSVKSSDKSE